MLSIYLVCDILSVVFIYLYVFLKCDHFEGQSVYIALHLGRYRIHISWMKIDNIFIVVVYCLRIHEYYLQGYTDAYVFLHKKMFLLDIQCR